MLAVGLTGGIGSGKSTVAALMAARGAVVVSADSLARDALAPGGAAHAGVVERFGPAVAGPGGTIDTDALAALVFADRAALADLNALTHPVVAREMAACLLSESAGDHVVILEIPLLVETGMGRVTGPQEAGKAGCPPLPMAAVIVVDVPDEVAMDRLVGARGMEEARARARMAAQASREERRAVADLVIDNTGSLPELDLEVERAWAFLATLPPRPAPERSPTGGSVPAFPPGPAR